MARTSGTGEISKTCLQPGSTPGWVDPIKVRVRCLQYALGPHLFYDQLDQSIDRLINFGRIEGISDSSPNQFSLRRRVDIEIGLDAHLLLFFQIIWRVDGWIDRAVVAVQSRVVRKGHDVGSARHVVTLVSTFTRRDTTTASILLSRIWIFR